jgi:hypothetical protein
MEAGLRLSWLDASQGSSVTLKRHHGGSHTSIGALSAFCGTGTVGLPSAKSVPHFV